MKKIDFRYALAGAAAISGLSACSEGGGVQSDKPMNIIYIMCDDHSYQTLSAYDNRFVNTPNIDRLADEGYRFTNSFVANSLSGPSRACMLTGKHSHINGFTNNEHGIFDNTQLTFPKLLQANGYQTAVVGKWHLVTEPTGFDHWDVLIGQGEYYQPRFIVNGDTVQARGYATDLVTERAIEWMESGRDEDKPFCLLVHHKAPHRSWQPAIEDLGAYDDVEFPLPDTFYDDYEGRLAAQLQEMQIANDMNVVYDLKMADPENEIHDSRGHWPFESSGRNLYLGSTDPDAPIRAGKMTPEEQKAWDAYYGPIIDEYKAAGLTGDAQTEWMYQRYMKDYCSVINSVDRNVGRLYDYLAEEGLLENTMIVYTSDQGFFMGEHGFFDKRFMYEESFRTPLIIRMPDAMGRPKPGKSSASVYGPDYGAGEYDINELVQNIDYGPTFLDLAGVEIPEEMQGESFLPLLMGERADRVQTSEGKGWRESLYYHFHEYPAEHAVRRHYGVRTDRYTLIHYYNDIDSWELYDLKEDPQQLNNIYDTPEGQKIVQELEPELRRLQVLYEDPVDQTL